MTTISCVAISCDNYDGKSFSAEDGLCPECRAHENFFTPYFAFEWYDANGHLLHNGVMTREEADSLAGFPYAPVSQGAVCSSVAFDMSRQERGLPD